MVGSVSLGNPDRYILQKALQILNRVNPKEIYT